MPSLQSQFSKELTSSGLFICPFSSWNNITTLLKKQLHPADFWSIQDLKKGLTMTEVRDLHIFASRSPVGSLKVALLSSVSEWRVEVSNALLKLLEEPPSYLRLLLLSESSNILSTIVSRVQLLSAEPEFATIQIESEQGTLRDQWESLLGEYNVLDPKQRQAALKILYTFPLVHTGIKAENILHSFKEERQDL